MNLRVYQLKSGVSPKIGSTYFEDSDKKGVLFWGKGCPRFRSRRVTPNILPFVLPGAAGGAEAPATAKGAEAADAEAADAAAADGAAADAVAADGSAADAAAADAEANHQCQPTLRHAPGFFGWMMSALHCRS